ncbi:MAG: sigma-54 interaction domain-containing protein [Nitrospinales bacterium]
MAKKKDTQKLMPDAEISEIQAIKYASEFSDLYWAEKKKRQQLESAHEELKLLYAELDELRQKLKNENEFLVQEIEKELCFGSVIGESPALTRVLKQVDSVAKKNVTVLIQGETGTGKELIAREIHQRSHRNDKPIIKVNCGAIPDTLFESEFFGHKKGAFTGAVKDRIGRFQLADGGTLFLDEVGEIPLDLQSKLLRVLQEGQFEQVGDDVTKEIDVRVVTATNRDLKEEVKEGRFREDLFYRLNVVPVVVPPLRERVEDIPLLANHFVTQACRQFNMPAMIITDENIQALQQYEWPGNIRELQNVVQRAVITASNNSLSFDSIQPSTQNSEDIPPCPDEKTSGNLQVNSHQLGKEAILAALKKTNWKVFGPRGAGELLKIAPANLSYRIKKLGLKKP